VGRVVERDRLAEAQGDTRVPMAWQHQQQPTHVLWRYDKDARVVVMSTSIFGPVLFRVRIYNLALDFYGDQVRNLGRARCVETVDGILYYAVGICDAFVLTQMFEPRFQQERLDHATFLGRVFEHSPRIGAVAAALLTEAF
jgi:hypothetical protein